MWPRPEQTAPFPHIFLLYVASDEKDAFLLKDALKTYYQCRVFPSRWNEINSLIGATRETLAEQSRLVLFVFSDAFLDALQKLDELGKEYKKLTRLLTSSRVKRGRPYYKAVVLTHCTKTQELVALSANYYAYDPRTSSMLSGLINWISSAGLVLRPEAPMYAMMPVDDEQQAPMGSPPSTALSRDRWYVPSGPEYNKDSQFLPGPVLPYGRTQEISGGEVFLHIYETFVNLRQRYVILHGAPGIGKTALAVQYMHEYSQKRDDLSYYCAVIWLDMGGRSEDDVTGEFARYRTIVQKLKAIGGQDIIEKERWLVVIDRCKSKHLEEVHRQLSLSSERCDTLIIMNSAPPVDKQFYTLKVLPLKEEYAIHLLQRSAMDFTNTNRESALKIVEDFNYHPLAIKNVGYFLHSLRDNNNGIDYKGYLAKYNTSGDLKAFGNYTNQLQNSFDLFIKELGEEDQEEEFLFLNCLMFAQKPLPEQLIRSIIAVRGRALPEEVESKFVQFKNILYRYSLRKENKENHEAASRDKEPLIAIEPIIVRQANEFLEEDAKQKGEEEALKTEFIHAVSLALPRKKWDRYAMWPLYLPHVHRCIYKLKINNTIAAVRLYYMTGRFLQEHPLPVQSTYFMDAQEFLYQARDIRKELLAESIQEGDDYPDLPTCESALAELEHERLLDCTQRADFDVQREKLLQDYEKILHAIRSRPTNTLTQPSLRAFQNVDELSVLNHLGRLYDDCGEYGQAQIQFRAALVKLGEMQGKDALEIRLIQCEIKNNIVLAALKEATRKGGNEEENRNDIDEEITDEEITKVQGVLVAIYDTINTLKSDDAEIIKMREDLKNIQDSISTFERDSDNNNFMRNCMLKNSMRAASTVLKDFASKDENSKEITKVQVVLATLQDSINTLKKEQEYSESLQISINALRNDIRNTTYMRNFMLRNDIGEKEAEAMMCEYQRRLKECEIQCNLHKIYASVLSESNIMYAERDLNVAVEEAKEVVEGAVRLFTIPSRTQYLSLLKRMNNLAEFYRINALKRRDRRERIREEEKAFNVYRDIDTCVHTKYKVEIIIPYYLKYALSDNLRTLMKQSAAYENGDIYFYEELAEYLEKTFFNDSVRGAR